MEKSKTAFRAIREECGLTQQDIADELGTNKTTVKRWERPDIEYYTPPDDVWAWLLGVREMMHADAEAAAQSVLDVLGDDRSKPVDIAYYRTQAELDAVQLSAGLDKPVGLVNATSRLAAKILENNGYEIRYIPGAIDFAVRTDAMPDSRADDAFPA